MAQFLLTAAGLLSNTFEVTRDGELLASLSCRYGWRNRGSMEIGETCFVLSQPSAFQRKYSLEQEDAAIGSACVSGAFRRSFDLEVQGRRLTLGLRAFLRNEFILADGDREIASIKPRGVMKRGAEIDTSGEIPLETLLFAAWISMLTWRAKGDMAVTAATA